MKMENLKKAAKASEDHERAVKALKWAQEARYFDVSSGPAPSSIVPVNGSTHAVYEDMGGPSGQFASDIRAALIRFREAHVKLAEDELRAFGVEIPAR